MRESIDSTIGLIVLPSRLTLLFHSEQLTFGELIDDSGGLCCCAGFVVVADAAAAPTIAVAASKGWEVLDDDKEEGIRDCCCCCCCCWSTTAVGVLTDLSRGLLGSAAAPSCALPLVDSTRTIIAILLVAYEVSCFQLSKNNRKR